MYPVAVGVIDLDTNDNWIWFMQRLWEVIGTPTGLTFSTDCGQAVMAGVTKFSQQQNTENVCGIWSKFSRKDGLGKYLMTICGLLLILGMHIGLQKLPCHGRGKTRGYEIFEAESQEVMD
jgi:hypothetical protein